MATTGVLYGRSDLASFQHLDHNHSFSKEKDRLPRPGYGDENRSLPILNCGQCRDFARQHLGFSPDPSKVELTSDEMDFSERAQRDGSLHMQLMAQSLGKALADTVREKASTGPAKDRVR